MKIKSYNLFLESKRYDISKEEENIIKKYFYDRLDGEVIEGKEIDEDTSDDYFRNQPMNTFKFSKSWYELDKNGQDEYNSKILKEKEPFFFSNTDSKEWISKFKKNNFSNYSTIIVNIKFESDLIIKYLDLIYNDLIEDGYLVSAWHPEPNEWRFHIATETSNPFQETENMLSKLFENYNLFLESCIDEDTIPKIRKIIIDRLEGEIIDGIEMTEYIPSRLDKSWVLNRIETNQFSIFKSKDWFYGDQITLIVKCETNNIIEYLKLIEEEINNIGLSPRLRRIDIYTWIFEIVHD